MKGIGVFKGWRNDGIILRREVGVNERRDGGV